MGRIEELLHRDHLAIEALLLQIGGEGPCTPEGVRTLDAEWRRHVDRLSATVAEAFPSVRAKVRDTLADDEEVRVEIAKRLDAMTSGGASETEIIQLAHELDALLVAHRRAEAAAVAVLAPSARTESTGWVLRAPDRSRL
jgi:hypothetical protein